MATVKRDSTKQKWEETEFPLVCETCLGDNPYLRMTKESHGKKCQICENPFTVFAWQAGTKGRLKRVEICRSCAQAKNVCQVCIYDLQYGLPVKVRDKVLRESGCAAAVSAIPQSNANRAWYTAQQQRVLDQGGNMVGDANALARAKLEEMAVMEPRYERNLPKLCSFFAKGECDRGANCPFRHEMPRDRNDPMAKQNTKDRFYGASDPVANKILGRKRRQEEEQQENDIAAGVDRARATLYLRFQGDPPFPADLTEMNIRDKFYAFGEIVSVRSQPDRGQAFVEYTTPEATELAISSMNRKELLGRQIYVSWANAPKRGEQSEQAAGDSENATTRAVKPLAPPGSTSKGAVVPKGFKAKIGVSRVPGLGSVPRPGGGPIRGLATNAIKRASSAPKPYYPSTNPSRLGSKTS